MPRWPQTEKEAVPEPAYTGQADEYEGGLIPSTAPEPVEVREARQTQEVASSVQPISPALAAKLGGLSPEDLQAVIGAATAGLRAELDAVRGELDGIKANVGKDGFLGENASVGGYPWMYWRKPANWPDETSRGWISYGPGGSTPKGNRDNGMYSVLGKKGLTPILRYGYIEPPKDEHGVRSFLPMLEKGGALEFPASQVMAYRWHVSPPIRGLKFPQYEKIKASVKTFECEECGKRYWYLPDTQRATAREYRGHLITGHKVPWREAAEAVTRAGLKLRSEDNQASVSVEEMTQTPTPAPVYGGS